ncbi:MULTISPECIES: hypothetical protein [Candidatus Ichthyocystis]|uniref:Putative membrane protein n=1 Tax=Candidatus Ichthyocystis hellenicum TaxID=1561003 RepID=A0A0S4M1A8_9BURK|nr:MULTISPECIES: hypothetical protein [Ichthyocystis]CUT17425.1 putative membrane protein [Candidatus Ichthyocystis hellenicum]
MKNRSSITLYVVITLLATPVNVRAGILSDQICSAYKNIFDASFYGIAIAAGLGGLLLAIALDEGGNQIKSRILRVSIAAIAIVNLDNIVSVLTGQRFVC